PSIAPSPPPASAPATPPRLEASPAPTAPFETRPVETPSGLTATPTPGSTRPAGSGVTACQAANLIGLVGFQGATQALAGDLVLTNHGAAPCSLDGPPSVRLVDAKGQALAIKGVTAPDAGPSQGVLVQPGQSVYVRLFWRDWCGPKPAFPVDLQADWPDSGGSTSTLLASGDPRDQHPLEQTPVCNAAGSASTLTVSPFRATP
ncbi:MAG: DUF4232 domain-containing protein, partial [Chloroflexota bacterium]